VRAKFLILGKITAMENHIVRKEILLDASTDKVWRALTDPKITKKYFYHCKVLSDWKVGSAITFKGKVFWIFPIELNGEIRQIIPGKLLQYTLHNHGGGQSLVTDELTNENGKTRLKITDDVGTANGIEKRYKNSMKGWDKILRGLKKTVENHQNKKHD
jgi:uncharacterized protein YndB with AHSA1/START domain